LARSWNRWRKSLDFSQPKISAAALTIDVIEGLHHSALAVVSRRFSSSTSTKANEDEREVGSAEKDSHDWEAPVLIR